jgi:murein DD-endopeptidase MepM/ murein hydrolase activator NlpD
VHRRFFNWAPPVFGALVLTVTILYWNAGNFALEVTYDGQTVGYVRTQQSYYSAADAVESTVRDNSDQLFALSGKPSFRLVMTDASHITPQSRLSDNLIARAGGQLVRAEGLYVDDAFVGAYSDGAAIRQMLNSIINSYKSHKKNVKTEQVSFLQKVTVKSGLFPRKTVATLAAMKQDLTHGEGSGAKYVARQGDSVAMISSRLNVPLTTLYNLNPSIGSDYLDAGQALKVKSGKPLLTIQVTRTEKYNKKVAYPTQRVKTNSLYVHKTQVKNNGKSGKVVVTAKVTYINGKVKNKTVVATKVVKKPVAKVLLVGIKPMPSTAATGNFAWPIRLGVACISSPFGGRRHHSGLDLACNQGTPIHAADGGRVEFAGWYSGYGNCVIIRHNGSLESLYGHCSKLLVSVGTRVFKGETIALVGHTGHVVGRTGNHCHFEVRVNGTAVNPLRFLR